MSFIGIVGEKGTLQHSWDLSNWKNTLTQFYFQLVRNSFVTNGDMKVLFRRLLTLAETTDTLRDYLYRLVMHTRDIQKGKGERDLFYTLLKEISEHHSLEVATQMLHKCCTTDAGSWKDIKYLVYHLDKDTFTHSATCDPDKAHPLSRQALVLLAKQIETDYKYLNNHQTDKISLAARWAPRREKGKFAFVTRLFVSIIHAGRKYNSRSMRDVRKLLSLLNADLKTPQIDMCRGTWSELDFNTMTSYTLLKHKLAFQNKTKDGHSRSEIKDRVTCATNYVTWLDSKDKKMNVSTVYPYEFVKGVMSKPLTMEEIKYYNDAWNTQLNAQMEATKDTHMGIMIPMIDVSGSMTCDNSLPLFNAIALGMRLSEMNNGVFHNRALTFESSPQWAIYDDRQTFVDKVRHTQRLGWGGTTNFRSALQKILSTIVRNNLSPLAVKHTSLVVFSDMQMDQSSRTPYSTVYESMRLMYHDAGMRSIYGTPYEVPHIVFWNLRKTDGFPTIGNETGVTMISGYNASMIEVLMNKGVNALRSMTPWDLLRDVLRNPRFSIE